MHNLLQHLNQEQRAAVTLPAQSALILAGAGSGKTRVLTTRIAWLIQSQQISASEVLAVTFTNKAAREMLQRLSAMLPINTRHMWIGTFHGLCHRLLRIHHRAAELPPSFQILDAQDQLSAVKRLLKTLNVDDEICPPQQLVYFINHAKEQGLRAQDMQSHVDYNRQCIELYALYDQQCQREAVVDFAELLLRTYELLSRDPSLREHYQLRFKHILVDEFQDTNDLQYKWLQLLGQHAALFAVGDDDQSIYAFRGANVDNMTVFEREFCIGERIKLEQNYRSHGHILDVANALIANNSKRLGKQLRTDAMHGEPVRVYAASDDLQEAQWVVDQIKALEGDGWARREIAILYRSNAQSRVLEHMIFSAGIPYRVYGGLRFFERAEIKHAMAYLQLMDNLHNDSAFLRVVNFPTRGIGAKALEYLQDAAQQQHCSLYAAIPHISGKAGSSLSAFADLISEARHATEHLPLPEVVQAMLKFSGLIAYYKNDKKNNDRIENLEQLVNAAALFLVEEGFNRDAPAYLGQDTLPAADATNVIADDIPLTAVLSPLSAFLAHACLEAGDNQAQAGQDALQLMTVHSAKGLEFDAVFITGLEEGLFPHENSMKEGEVEEERRLMYVAITRARKRLYMSCSRSRMLHGQVRYNMRSRFFNELPKQALQHLSLETRDYPTRGSQFSANKTIHSGHPSQLPGLQYHGWRVGQAVMHDKFGEGFIINIEGSGDSLCARIQFNKTGVKLLDLNVARLDKLF